MSTTGPSTRSCVSLCAPELLVRHWDDLNRLAASLKDGLVALSLIIAKLQALRQDPAHLELHRRRGAQAPSAGRTEPPRAPARHGTGFCFGRQGRFGDRGYEAQLNRASALSLVINALTVWNTRYLQAAAEELAHRASR
jgi:TnpA family transposase